MASLQIAIPSSSSSSSSSSQNRVHAYAAIALPKHQRIRISLPKKPSLSSSSSSSTKLVLQVLKCSEKDVITTTTSSQTCYHVPCDPSKCKDIIKLHAILKAVAERIEVHNYWNSLLFKSLNMMMVGLNTAIDNTALKLSSTLLFSAATGTLFIISKIQTFEPSSAVWWPNNGYQMKVLRSQKTTTNNNNNNGWSPELEMEMRDIIEVVKRKDKEDYERLGNLALNINKTLAILGPVLTLVAALGSALARHGSVWAGTVAVMAGSLADSISAVEHGGQVGMVFEMYRNCGGFFKLLQDTIEATLEEKDPDKRENGELFELRVAKKLGRSVSQLRQLASKSAAICDSNKNNDNNSKMPS